MTAPREMEPQRWFAWYPVTLWDTMRWAWLRSVWRRKERLDLASAIMEEEVWGWFRYENRPTNDYWRDGKGAMSDPETRRKYGLF